MWKDFRYALRTIAKTPGFAAIAVLAIALGIGPNSTVFSLVNAVLLKPLPIQNPDRVVMVWESLKTRSAERRTGVSGPDFLDWKRESQSFEEMVAANGSSEYGYNVTTGGEPERVLGGRANAGFLKVLGVTPVLGRDFSADEDRAGGPRVALISYQLWQRRFGSDPAIVGRAIGLDGISHTIIAVLPADLRSFGSVDVFTPQARDMAQSPRDSRRYGILGRLKPGVTPAQAQAELTGIAARLEQRYPDTNRNVGVTVIPLATIFAPVRALFAVLFGAVGFLLAMACANVAGLLLARGAARQRELAVRAALGAGTRRLVRQLLAESLLLALAGGVAGLLLSAWSLAELRHELPDIVPRLKDMGVNAMVLAFTLAASLITGLLFGLFPALRAARTDLNQVLNDGSKGVASGGGHRARSALLALQFALAAALLIGSGLLIRSFANLMAINPGFRTSNLLTMRLSLPDAKYRDPVKRAAFARNLLRRTDALPGVQSSSTINVLPFRTYFLDLPAFVSPYHVVGQPAVLPNQQPTADYRIVSRAFLSTMGIRLVRGRDFTEHDNADAPHVTLVNETLARLCCAGENVLGKHIEIGGASREVIGVIPDVRLNALDADIRAAVLIPNDQDPSSVWTLVVRTSSNPAALSAAVRRAVLEEDGEQPVSDILTMDTVVRDSVLLRRLSMSMLVAFAALALLLAGIGIYGLTSYTVSRRTHEIGLRMALGADRGDVIRLVVGGGLRIGVIGVALGLPAALLIGRLLKSLLFGVVAADPVIFVSVPIVLLAIAGVASYIPARRATRVDPVIALRGE